MYKTANRARDREKIATMLSSRPTPGEKRAALEEVLQSAAFFRADQLRSFLRYICEMELSGRGDELCESLIGVEAFGRPADYSPTEDASVRRRAGDLREKLQEVYATELAGSRLRIELPKGKFIPRFVRVAPENGADAAPVELFPLEHSALKYPADRLAPAALPAQFDANVITARLDAALLKKTKIWRRRLITFWFAMGWIAGAVMVTGGLFAYRWLRPPVAEAPSLQAVNPQIPRTRVETPPGERADSHAETRSVVRDAAPPSVAAEYGSYEAEAASNTMHGITEPYPCNHCSGGTRVRNIGKYARNYLVVNNIVVPKSGSYTMSISYLLKGSRSFFISVNDAAPVEVPLTGRSWMQVSNTSIKVPLKAGSNRVKFYNGHDYAPDLDRVVIGQP